jgi:hypothetical protein
MRDSGVITSRSD